MFLTILFSMECLLSNDMHEYVLIQFYSSLNNYNIDSVMLFRRYVLPRAPVFYCGMIRAASVNNKIVQESFMVMTKSAATSLADFIAFLGLKPGYLLLKFLTFYGASQEWCCEKATLY